MKADESRCEGISEQDTLYGYVPIVIKSSYAGGNCELRLTTTGTLWPEIGTADGNIFGLDVAVRFWEDNRTMFEARGGVEVAVSHLRMFAKNITRLRSCEIESIELDTYDSRIELMLEMANKGQGTILLSGRIGVGYGSPSIKKKETITKMARTFDATGNFGFFIEQTQLIAVLDGINQWMLLTRTDN